MDEIPNLDANITRKDLEGRYIEQSLIGGPGRTLMLWMDAFGGYVYKVYFFASLALETKDLDEAINFYNNERPAPPSWWGQIFEMVDKMEKKSNEIDPSVLMKGRSKPDEN